MIPAASLVLLVPFFLASVTVEYIVLRQRWGAAPTRLLAGVVWGNALSYALTNDDLIRTVESFAAHTQAGALLIADVLNARCYLQGDGFQRRIEGTVDTPEFKATSVSMHSLDQSSRVLKRRRVWHIPGRPDVEDYAEYRLLYPEELRRLLETSGFEVAGMYDNRRFMDSDLAGTITAVPDIGGMRGRKLYAFARKR